MSPIMQKTGIIATLAMAACLSMTLPAMAQQVYRCEVNGKVSYSNEPCQGAKVVNTTPAQSSDKTSDQQQKNLDTLKAELERNNATKTRALAAKTPEDPEVAKRRENLTPLAKHSCSLLDQSLPQLRENAAHGTPENKEKADIQLYKARKAFQDLRC